MRASIITKLVGLLVLGLSLSARPAQAQSAGSGFQMNRYEPTTAGEWSFMVDHPWYSSTRLFSVGMTLNYGHNPLVYGLRTPEGEFTRRDVVISHQLLGHVDFALAFWDRINVSFSLPVTFLERGQELGGITPIMDPVVGDPRLGAMFRLWGQPDESVFSISLGANVWIPIGVAEQRAGDTSARVLPRLVLAGLWSWLRWSFTGGFYYRPESSIGNLADPRGSTVGPAIQFGGSLAYADKDRRFSIGPEILLYTTVFDKNAFKKDYTHLDLLLGAHYNIARIIQAGLALGVGTLRDPGTPDFRLLFRLAYAPIRSRDRDKDGILDKEDACPDQRGIRTNDPRTNGCPPGDRDNDKVIDPEDMCPDEHMGRLPDPRRRGCPSPDTDGDKILDPEDLCPTVHHGEYPDPNRLGCPAGDRDNDKVVDPIDRCPDVPQGLHPDPDRPGCPMPDRDGDIVPDVADACPDTPGRPSADPKKNGCPGLVKIQMGKLVILRPVFFATDEDVILPQSYPVLHAVAEVLSLEQGIRRISIEGHTDNRGTMEHNMDLSERRARNVKEWLVRNGIAEERVESHGYGPTRPVAPNTSPLGRQKNRRVEFVIIDPPFAGGSSPAQEDPARKSPVQKSPAQQSVDDLLR